MFGFLKKKIQGLTERIVGTKKELVEEKPVSVGEVVAEVKGAAKDIVEPLAETAEAVAEEYLQPIEKIVEARVVEKTDKKVAEIEIKPELAQQQEELVEEKLEPVSKEKPELVLEEAEVKSEAEPEKVDTEEKLESVPEQQEMIIEEKPVETPVEKEEIVKELEREVLKPTEAEPVEWHVRPEPLKEIEGKVEEEVGAELELKETKLAKARVKKAPEKKKAKVGLLTRVKRTFIQEVALSDKEIDDALWEFELALLEGDVASDVAAAICKQIKTCLKDTKFKKGEDIEKRIEGVVKHSIECVLGKAPILDFAKHVKKAKKPFVIVFFGPNGAGKTTSMAKVAHLLRKENMSSIFAAADTFRAASIEQLEEHARRLGIRVVKQRYGADPAAVAYDAIESAKANGIDCVLVDTAGRQDTNRNLVEELKKVIRVTKPNMKIYVAEALAGNAILDQVVKIHNEIELDGVILTKMDMDVKGGGAISVAYGTGVPILFFGVGQKYGDLVPFAPDEIIKRIF